jgi:hypothetical protein
MPGVEQRVRCNGSRRKRPKWYVIPPGRRYTGTPANGTIVTVDWDLDSPGLHRYFHPFLDAKLVAATPGVIELVNDYACAAAAQKDQPPGWHQHYARVLPHAISLNWPHFPGHGCLDYMSAGRQNRDYPSSLTSIDWDNFYDRLNGGQFIDGAASVARSVDQRYHYRNIRVLPVPMRIDEAEKDKSDAGLDLARSRFDPFPKGMGEYEKSDYWPSVVIPYKPYYAFEETLAAFGDIPRSPLTLLGAYERLTGRSRRVGSALEGGDEDLWPPQLTASMAVPCRLGTTRPGPIAPSAS